MNICLFNNIFPPINTGSSHYTYDLAVNLTKIGHKVIVITCKTKQNIEDYTTDKKGFTVFWIKNIRFPKLKIWLSFPDFYFTLLPSNFRKVKKILIDNEIQLLHQCNNIFDLVFISAHFSRKLKIPLICSLTTQIQHRNKVYNSFLEIFDRIIIKYLFSKTVNKYIALDLETKRYINERYNRFHNVDIIPFGVSGIENFSGLKMDYEKSNFVMVSLGHISELKDRKELLIAWDIVRKKFPQSKLRIIGALFNRDIEKLIKHLNLGINIELTGRIDHKFIPDYIKDADIGTMFFSKLPYHKGIGTANLELMAAGIPVILDANDDFFGISLPFKNNKHYILLESRDPQWLADRIIKLFENRNSRKIIGQSGKQFVLDQLDWDKIILLIEQLYKQVITGSTCGK